MSQEYTIIQIFRIGQYKYFDKAILVIIVPVNQLKKYNQLLNSLDPDDEEKRRELEICLIFKDYRGKMQWLRDKECLCDDKIYWELDLDLFIRVESLPLRDNRTNVVYYTESYQVKLVSENLDKVEYCENI